MYYYRLSDNTLASSRAQVSFSGGVEISEEEYNQALKLLMEQQKIDERAEKEALFRKLRAELYPPEEE